MVLPVNLKKGRNMTNRGMRGHWQNAQSIHPWTEDLAKQMLMQVRRAALKSVLEDWTHLSDDQRADIGDVARAIRKATKSATASRKAETPG